MQFCQTSKKKKKKKEKKNNDVVLFHQYRIEYKNVGGVTHQTFEAELKQRTPYKRKDFKRLSFFFLVFFFHLFLLVGG